VLWGKGDTWGRRVEEQAMEGQRKGDNSHKHNISLWLLKLMFLLRFALTLSPSLARIRCWQGGRGTLFDRRVGGGRVAHGGMWRVCDPNAAPR